MAGRALAGAEAHLAGARLLAGVAAARQRVAEVLAAALDAVVVAALGVTAPVAVAAPSARAPEPAGVAAVPPARPVAAVATLRATGPAAAGAAAEARTDQPLIADSHGAVMGVPREAAVMGAAVQVGRIMTATSAPLATARMAARDMAAHRAVPAGMTVAVLRVQVATPARGVMTMAAAAVVARASAAAPMPTGVDLARAR
jgi:hypothetical protein